MIDLKFFNKIKVGSHWINRNNDATKKIIYQEKQEIA